MVDITTLIVISTVTQTIVITITLIVFILQFRSQEMAIKEASYQGLLGRYNDFIRSVVENPELARFFLDASEAEKVSNEEARIYAHLLVAYGILEEAFLLYAKKWIKEDDWQQWSAWLVALSRRPEMKRIHERTKGTFDKRFEEYVSRMYSDMDGRRETSGNTS